MTPPLELVFDLALLGVLFVFLLFVSYGFLCGWLAGRPTKMQKAILHRALLAYPRSQDPIIAAKELRLLRFLEAKE